MVKCKTDDREVPGSYRVDAILLCVYFSVPFIFLFFFFSFFDKKTESKGIQYVIVKNAGSVTLTIVVNDS